MHRVCSSSCIRGLHLALLTMLTLFPLLAANASAQKGAARTHAPSGHVSQAPMDLPAMTLRPTDLANAGIGDMGVSFGVLTDDADEAGAFVEYSNIDPESDDISAFVEANAGRYHILEFDNSYTEDDGGIYYTVKIVAFVLEYDDEHEAGDGLDAMWGVWNESDLLTEERLTGPIGDDEFYFAGEGIDNDSFTPTERSLLVFQEDTIVAGILTYNSNNDGAFSQHVNEALGHAILERVEDGLDGAPHGLGSAIVRLDVPSIGSFYDTYGTIDGEVLCASEALLAGECDAFQDLVDEYNEVDRYNVMFNILGDDDSASSFVLLSLRTFGNEDSAEMRFDEMRESWTTVATDMEDLDLGDDAFRWSEVGGTVYSESILVRSGNVIIEVSQQATYEIDPDGLDQVAGHQLACLDGLESCTEPLAIPDAMLPDEAHADARSVGRSASL